MGFEHWKLIRACERLLTLDGHRYGLERELCLKLIRTLLGTPRGPFLVPLSVLRLLVAMAEHPDDKLRAPTIETLCELAVLNPQGAFECGAIKLLFSLLVEGPKELLDAIVLTVLHLLDAQDSRVFIRPNVELEVL